MEMAGKTVKVMRVRPRAAYRDQNDDAARRGMGQIIEVSQKVADNAKLMKREGYVKVTDDAKRNESKPVREPVDAPRQEEVQRNSDVPEVNEPKLPDGKANEVDITDAAKALADEHFIDLAQVTGTGRGGKITKGDIQKLVDNG